MPTPFEIAAAQTSAAVDTIYGETFTFVGMKAAADARLPKAVDADRPAFSVIGGWVGPAKSVYPRAPGRSSDQAQRHAASEPFVSVDNARMQWQAVTGDRVTRLKTGIQYEISRPMPDNIVRTLYFLAGKTA